MRLPYLKLLVLLLALVMPLAAFAAPTILVYGDSLSAAYGIPKDQSWVSLLQKKLRAQGYPHTVANASISGETSSGGRARIERTLQAHRPQLVILALGANDGLRGLPVHDMQDNLSHIIAACRQHQAQVLLVGMRLPPNYGPRYTAAFFDSYASLAAQQRLPLLAFLLENVAGQRELTQDDGLHPTAQAQPLIVENVWRKLKPLLGKPARRAAS